MGQPLLHEVLGVVNDPMKESFCFLAEREGLFATPR